jgi:hypothetical protein
MKYLTVDREESLTVKVFRRSLSAYGCRIPFHGNPGYRARPSLEEEDLNMS